MTHLCPLVVELPEGVEGSNSQSLYSSLSATFDKSSGMNIDMFVRTWTGLSSHSRACPDMNRLVKSRTVLSGHAHIFHCMDMFVRTWTGLSEHLLAYPDMNRLVKSWIVLLGHGYIFHCMDMFVRTWTCLSGHGQVCQGMDSFVRTWRIFSEHGRVRQGMGGLSGHGQVCQDVDRFVNYFSSYGTTLACAIPRPFCV